MGKGPFWVICKTVYDELDFSESTLLSFPVSDDQEPTPSHINVWKTVKGNLRQSWDYYPRGRVEIRRGKVIVFANPLCFCFDKLEESLRDHFQLGELPIVFKADNSSHYGCEFNKNN